MTSAPRRSSRRRLSKSDALPCAIHCVTHSMRRTVAVVKGGGDTSAPRRSKTLYGTAAPCRTPARDRPPTGIRHGAAVPYGKRHLLDSLDRGELDLHGEELQLRRRSRERVSEGREDRARDDLSRRAAS